MSPSRAVFIDRDGVITELVPDPVTGRPESPLEVAEVALCAGAAEGLRRLAEADWLLIGVSNQPAAAKGKVSVEQLQGVQARTEELLHERGVRFDAFRLCLHHPDGVVAKLSGPCCCRKPAPGMLLDSGAALDVDFGRSWMIGDTDADVLAGHRAGCKTVLVQNRASVHKRGGDAQADAVAANLYAAIQLVLPSDRDLSA